MAQTMPMTPEQRINAGPSAYMKPQEAAPEFTEAYSAGFVDEQMIMSWSAETENKTAQELVDGYDQFKDIPDDLVYLPTDTWGGVKSPAQMQNRVTDIRTQIERDGDIQGWGGFLGQMTGFIMNPEVIATLGLGGIGMRGTSLGARLLKGASFGAAGDVLHEAGMRDTQELRTAQESAINIGAASVLTGLISGGFGKTVAKPLTNFAYREMAENVENFGMRHVSAAQAYDYNSEKILNQPWITTGFLSPMRPLVASKSKESLWWLNNLWEHSYTTGKTVDGRAQQIAMETEVDQQIAILMRRNHEAVNSGYKAYVGAGNRRELMAGVIKNRGKRVQFDEDVHRAMVNEDKFVGTVARSADEIKAIEATAQRLRSEIYDVTLKIAKEAELIDPEDFAVKFAKSYAPRRWNKKAVLRDQIAVKQSLKESYIKERGISGKATALTASEKRVKTLSDELLALPKTTSNTVVKKIQTRLDEAFAELEELKARTETSFEPKKGTAEMQSVSDDVQGTFDRIAYGYDQDVFMGLGGVGAKSLGSPLTARKVPLDDNFLLDKGWLDSNMDGMTMSHINHMIKPAAMKMKVGDPEMTGALESIQRNYDDLIEEAEKKVVKETDVKKRAKLEKEARRLNKEKTNVIDMHQLMRDRWYGRKSVPNTRLGAQVNDFLRVMRNYNTALMMGMVLPTSIGDVARWNMATIYAPELGVAGPNMLKAFKTMNLNKAEMQRVGIAHEVATQLRTAKIIDGSDILGSHGTGVVMDGLVHASSAASKALIKSTLLTQWTDLGKLMAASYIQNDLIQKAMGYAKLSIKSKSTLARMGIDEDMATAIRKEVQESLGRAEADTGINRVDMNDMGYKGAATVINYEKIADKHLAKKLQTIIFRESERSLVTPKTGDMPMWLGDSELGRSVGQFTTFLHGAVQQVGVPIGKRLRYDKDPKAAIAASSMMMGGLLSVHVRMAIQGRLDEMEDWTAMDYALNAADYSGVVPLQMFLFNGLNLLSRGTLGEGTATMARTTNRPVASVMGPTAGTLSNLIGVAQIPFSEDGISESEARKMRRAVLWNNLMWTTAGATELEKQIVGDDQ